MNDDAADTARLSIIWHVVRRRWRLLVVVAVLGALSGAAASLVISPGYETSASVLLQGPRDADELLTEAQVAHSSVVLDRAAAALRWGRPGTDLADDVTAVVAEGNIITITAVADSPVQAQQLADRVAQEYVTFTTQLMTNTADASAQVSQEQQQTLRQQIIETNQMISDLHNSAGEGQTIDSVGTRTELESLRTALSQAVAKLDELDSVSGQAKMVVMGAAELPPGPAAPTTAHLAAGGAVLFFLLGLFGHLLWARTDKRLRNEAGIAAALGTGVLGGIDVPDVPARAEAAGRKSPREKLIGLVVPDGPLWDVPELPVALDEAGLGIRYRRTMARLRERLPSGPGRVLVVVTHDDAPARRVADRLGEVAGESGLVLEVAEVSADRPTVPDAAVPGVLVVVTAGTRTGWELAGLTGACADAGHDVLGVVVAHRSRAQAPQPGEQAEPALAGAR